MIDLLEPRAGGKALLDLLLSEQQQLATPVTHIAQEKEAGSRVTKFRELIPLKEPLPGEQYAFQVDLDICSGCKACVAACHSLNGLDDSESWRDIGGLTNPLTGSQRTVTTACHHCADPACANGCPTLAYEKDPVTGIVHHLDDQCIGCQYCELKCPYEVPKYSKELGIVRKCDMCRNRLAEGEAPACVQACPNQAIRIVTVTTEEVEAAATPETQLLPATVSSDYTKPTTQYRSRIHDDPDWLPADAYQLKAACPHPPLVAMLFLTQFGIGLFLADTLLRMAEGGSWGMTIIGAVVLMTGLAASILHLGQPLKAWKAFLNVRKSWLSREVVVFGALPPAVFGAVALTSPWTLSLPVPDWIGSLAVVLAGLPAVFCSVMVYVDTRRPYWGFSWTMLRFFGTMTGLGLAAGAVVSGSLGMTMVAGAILLLKLGVEGAWFVWWTREELRPLSAMSRAAWTWKRCLPKLTSARFTLGFTGLSLLLILPIAGLLCLVASEVVERVLFFRGSAPPKMPGAL